MITLTAFRQNLLQLFRHMAKHEMYVDVAYRGGVYRIHVENLHQVHHQKRRPRTADLCTEIKQGKCHLCKKLMINGICMNPKCGGRLAGDIFTPATTATQPTPTPPTA